jgi:transposase
LKYVIIYEGANKMDKQNKLYKFLEERKARILASRQAGASVKKIAAREGMSIGRVYQILREKGWYRNAIRSAQQPAQTDGVGDA